MMKQASIQRNRNTVNLFVDITIFLAFLVAMAPHFSGMAVHEWLGISFGAAIVTHLLLHWQWLVEVTKRFFSKAQWSARINYMLNALLFIDVTTIIFTGLMISKSALPALGITLSTGGAWRSIHGFSADLFMVLIGLHVALHWQWIFNSVKRLVVRQPAARLPEPAGAGAPRARQEV
jgi:cytochrome b